MIAIASTLAAYMFFQSPAALASRFLHYPRTAAPPKITVLVRTENFALMKYSNGEIDGFHGDGFAIAKRFSFGWQLLGVTEKDRFSYCVIKGQGIPVAVSRKIAPFLDGPRDLSACRVSAGDSGPPREIDSVRKFMAQTVEVIGPVRVIGVYAMAEHVNDGGGETFLKKIAGKWVVIADGGGAWTAGDLHARHGVPLAIARELVKEW